MQISPVNNFRKNTFNGNIYLDSSRSVDVNTVSGIFYDKAKKQVCFATNEPPKMKLKLYYTNNCTLEEARDTYRQALKNPDSDVCVSDKVLNERLAWLRYTNRLLNDDSPDYSRYENPWEVGGMNIINGM